MNGMSDIRTRSAQDVNIANVFAIDRRNKTISYILNTKTRRENRNSHACVL